MAEISSVSVNPSIATAIGNNVSTELGAVLGTQLGTQLGAAIGNIVTQAVGTAVNQAAAQLNQQSGMPKFLVNEIGNITNTAVQGLTTNVTPAAQNTVQTATAGSIEAFIQNLTKTIVDSVQNQLKNGNGTGTGEVKASGGSWMQAIAQAMGEAMGKKASKMVELASKIQALSAQSGNGTELSDADKMKAASETQVLNAQFQATGQEFNLLQTTFSTAIKTIGEGMSSVARKQ